MNEQKKQIKPVSEHEIPYFCADFYLFTGLHEVLQAVDRDILSSLKGLLISITTG